MIIRISDGFSELQIANIEWEQQTPQCPEDADWISCQISCRSQSFSGQTSASLCINDFHRFGIQLNDHSNQVAVFNTMEESLEIKVTFQRGRSAVVNCTETGERHGQVISILQSPFLTKTSAHAARA
jgi:hypothetical protein